MSGDVSVWFLGYFPWLSSFVQLLAFLAPIVGGGELGVIAVSFLFARNTSAFWTIVLFSFLGMTAMDSLWFYISRSKLFGKFKEWRKISVQYKSIEQNIERLSRGKDILIISLAKVMVGTRILLVLYIGGRKISFWRFFSYNILPTGIWAIMLALIGLGAAKGFNSIISIFKSVQLAITLLIIFLVGIYIMQKWMSQKLMKRPEV